MLQIEFIISSDSSTLTINDSIQFTVTYRKTPNAHLCFGEFCDRGNGGQSFYLEDRYTDEEFDELSHQFKSHPIQSIGYMLDTQRRLLGRCNLYLQYRDLIESLIFIQQASIGHMHTFQFHKVLVKDAHAIFLTTAKNASRFRYAAHYYKAEQYYIFDDTAMASYYGESMDEAMNDLFEEQGQEIVDMVLLSLS